jgi:hypothetical protein
MFKINPSIPRLTFLSSKYDQSKTLSSPLSITFSSLSTMKEKIVKNKV